MSTYRAKGIVIKYTDLREADRIITFYTANLGKVQAVAKGVRKTLSKLGCHFDLFSLVQLELTEGRNLDTVIGAQAVDCFSNIRKSLSKTSQVYYLAELINKLVPDEYKDTRIFDLLSSTLKILNSDVWQSEIEEGLVVQAFKMKLLQLIGFSPQLGECVQCSQPASPSGEYFFVNQSSGIRCKSCRKGSKSGTKLSAMTLKLLRTMSKKDFIYISKIVVDNKTLSATNDILDNYIKFIIEQEPRSLRFVAKVKGLADKP